MEHPFGSMDGWFGLGPSEGAGIGWILVQFSIASAQNSGTKFYESSEEQLKRDLVPYLSIQPDHQ